MEMTAAATTPVVAASNAPTSTTASASPPRIGPNTSATVSSRSSARWDLSSTRPMKVKNGIASSSSLDMMPNTRSGSACISAGGIRSSATPSTANPRPQAASPNTTGTPLTSINASAVNITGARLAPNHAIIDDRLAMSWLAVP